MKKRILAAMLCAAMLTGMMSGCGETGASEASKTETPAETGTESAKEKDKGKPAELQLVLYGEASNRMKELSENELKDRLLEDLNIDLTLTYVPWSEYSGGKVDLMLASGENFATYTDVKYTAQCASKGMLADLTEAAETCIPHLKEQVVPEAFDCFTIGGKLYSVPIGSRPSSAEGYCVNVRQDLLEEVGMKEISSLEDLEQFYDLCKEKHPDYVGYVNMGHFVKLFSYQTTEKNIEMLDNINDDKALAFVNNSSEDDTVYSLYESEEFKKTAEITRRWYEKGIIPEYALTNPSQLETDWNAGKAMMTFGNGTSVLGVSAQMKSMVPEARTKVYFLGTGKSKIQLQPYNTAWLVSAEGQENAADYLRLFDYMQKDQETVDFLTYGVEGTDYKIENGRIERISTDAIFDDWMLANKDFVHFDAAVTDEAIEEYRHWDDDAVVAKSLGFQFDVEPVKIQKAKLDSVVAEYGVPIMCGFVSYDDGYDTLLKKLKEAGIDEYLAEMQKQFTEFMASKAK